LFFQCFDLCVRHLLLGFLRHLVRIALVLGFDPFDLFPFPLVDLAVNAFAMFFHQYRNLSGIAVGVVMDNDPYHILGAEFILAGELPVMARRIDKENLIAPLNGSVLPQDKQTGRDTRPVKDVQRQGYDCIDESGFQKGLTNKVFVIGLPAFYLGISVFVKFVGLLLDLRLPPEEHPLATMWRMKA